MRAFAAHASAKQYLYLVQHDAGRLSLQRRTSVRHMSLTLWHWAIVEVMEALAVVAAAATATTAAAAAVVRI